MEDTVPSLSFVMAPCFVCVYNSRVKYFFASFSPLLVERCLKGVGLPCDHNTAYSVDTRILMNPHGCRTPTILRLLQCSVLGMLLLYLWPYQSSPQLVYNNVLGIYSCWYDV